MSKYTDHTISHRLTDGTLKGRGAVSNQVGRFERHQRESFDDGWDHDLPKDKTDPFADSNQVKTALMIDSSKKIITYNESPDIPFDRSINPYRGCEHGCIYCFARPSHSYWGLSAGLDFETKLFYKPNAVDLLEKELADPNYRPAPIAFGTNTDPYQPVEAEKMITRDLLAKLTECRHPFTVVTKNNMILRDLDILKEAARYNLVRVMISVTTLDHKLANKMEPRATTPKKRLEAIQELHQAGIPVGSLVAPIIPAINDHEIEKIVENLRDYNAQSVGYVLIRMPYEIKDLFAEWLQEHFPDRKDRVTSLINQCRDGQLNHSEFGKRMAGTGPVAQLIKTRFSKARIRFFLNNEDPEQRKTLFKKLSIENFSPPTPKGGQFTLI